MPHLLLLELGESSHLINVLRRLFIRKLILLVSVNCCTSSLYPSRLHLDGIALKGAISLIKMHSVFEDFFSDTVVNFW